MNHLSLKQTEETLAQLWTQAPRPGGITDESSVLNEIADQDKEAFRNTATTYQQHVLNKRIGYTRSHFPLTYKLLRDEWEEIVHRYWVTKQTSARQTDRALSEFPSFLRNECQEIRIKFPFVAELADYELTKVQVLKTNEQFFASGFNSIQILKNPSSFFPIPNPTIILKTYEFPIAVIAERIARKIPKGGISFENVSTTLAFYQEPSSFDVKIQQLGNVTAAMITDSRSKQTSFTELAKNALFRLNDPHNDELHKMIIETIARLYAIGLYVDTGRFEKPLQD